MKVTHLHAVHENEAQRRHARVRLPCKMQIEQPGHPVKNFSVIDLSASGFAVEGDLPDFQKGKNFSGRLLFNFETLSLGLDVKCTVISRSSDSLARLSCEFHDLGRDEVSTLRMIITKFLAGELMASGDILTTLSRDNFTKARNTSYEALSGWAKYKAIAGVGLMSIVGLVAFAYTASKLHESFFVAKATTAFVSITSNYAIAPREGYLTSLVKAGDLVSVGQTIATLDSPLLEVMQSILEGSGLGEAELRAMMAKRVSAVIESSCDCRVISPPIMDGKYIIKGGPTLQLAPADAKPEIYARFDFKYLDQIIEGKEVTIDMGDGSDTVKGVIREVTVPDDLSNNSLASTALLAKIEPAETFDLKLIGRPVNVSNGSRSLLELFADGS